MDKSKIIKLLKFSNEILEICHDRDEYPNSDLQGVIEATVMKIYNAGAKDTQIAAEQNSKTTQEGGETI